MQRKRNLKGITPTNNQILDRKKPYRRENARKVNAKRYPDGNLYILRLKGFDLYKIGCSQNIKRRLKDINAILPFETELVYIGNFYDVYDVEKMVHDYLKINHEKGEWYLSYEDEMKELIRSLRHNYLKENGILKESSKETVNSDG